jgi:hypothetical protein
MKTTKPFTHAVEILCSAKRKYFLHTFQQPFDSYVQSRSHCAVTAAAVKIPSSQCLVTTQLDGVFSKMQAIII